MYVFLRNGGFRSLGGGAGQASEIGQFLRVGGARGGGGGGGG